jgi:chondroitin AC lyase
MVACVDDVGVLRHRFRQDLRKYRAPVEPPGADGGWADIDYDNRDPADWGPLPHLTRMRSLAVSDASTTALQFWLDRDPQSDNWWHNHLGTPIVLGDTAVLLDDVLTTGQRQLIADRVDRAVWTNMTGQNLIWAANAQLRRGILLDDPDIIADALDRVKSTIVLTEGDGVQPDYSFHQHGPLLYFGAYGHDFAVDGARLAYLSRDTGFRFAQSQLDVLTGYFLAGLQWAVQGRSTYDFTAVGRVISRPSTQDDALQLAEAARWLAAAGSQRPAELLEFADRIDGVGERLIGNRHFWRSDYQTHHRPGWSSAVKMCSTRTAPTETGNGEALRNWYMGAGINPVWLTGNEYRDIFPVWNWRQLPGLTAEQNPGALPVLDWHRAPDGSTIRGRTDFVGGVSDGEYGFAAMQVRKDNIAAGRKAWFFFDDEVVALGAGIDASAAEFPVYTTLNQSIGDAVESGPGWAHDGRIGYVLLRPADLLARTETRTSSWRDISRPESAAPISRPVVTVAIDHGRAPQGAEYAYVLLPGATRERTETYQSEVVILANTADVQAIRHDRLGLTQVAFHRPGRLGIGPDTTIAVDQPVLLQLRGDRLSMANPTSEPIRVTLDLGTARDVHLPAGQTEVVQL